LSTTIFQLQLTRIFKRQL